MNNNDEIKKANRKAMPKFLLIMFIGMIIGGIFGFCAARYGLNTLADSMKSAGAFFGTYVAPWLMLGTAVIVPAVCIPIYKGAKKLLSAWDGENEEIYDSIDQKLSINIWITSAVLSLSYFLLAATYSGGFEIFEDGNSVASLGAGIVGLSAIIIETIVIQQKCVDVAKSMNSEKTASVYDTRFQKKWVDSCDEAEKIVIGKCAFKAYSTTNTVCAVLAIVLAVGALIFNVGFLPSLAVCLIWTVNQSVYCKEALRYSKAGNRIS